MTPKWDETNPYQELLMHELKEKGINASIKKSFPIFSFVIQILRSDDIDILHLHWADPFFVVKYGKKSGRIKKYSSLFLTILKSLFFIIDVEIIKLCGIKIVWTIHDKYDHDEKHKRIQIYIYTYLCRRVDEISVTSDKSEEIVRDLFDIPASQSIFTVGHGNYIDVYTDDVDREQARSTLGIESNKFVFLYFGSIRKYKGVIDLLEAYIQINTEDSCLYIVGEVREESIQSRLETAKNKKDIILVPDYVPENRIQFFFNACDVVVLPFRDILTSGSVMLAMGFGCPLIVPEIGSITDTVPKTNFLYTPKDENLKITLERAHENSNLSSIGEQNYQCAKEMTWEKVAQKTIKMYESATNEKIELGKNAL